MRMSCSGKIAKIASAGSAIRASTTKDCLSTGSGSSPAAARRVASGSRCSAMPIATQTTALAATAAAA